MSENIPCDYITLDSWYALPMTLRVKDFCSQCEFKCEHGQQIIKKVNSLPQCSKK